MQQHYLGILALGGGVFGGLAGHLIEILIAEAHIFLCSDGYLRGEVFKIGYIALIGFLSSCLFGVGSLGSLGSGGRFVGNGGKCAGILSCKSEGHIKGGLGALTVCKCIGIIRLACSNFGHSVEYKKIFSGGIKVVKLKVIITLLVGLCGHFAQCAVLHGSCIGACKIENSCGDRFVCLDRLNAHGRESVFNGHSCAHLSGGGKGGGGFLVKEGHFGVAVVAFLKEEAGIDPVGIVAVIGAVAVADAEGQLLGARGNFSRDLQGLVHCDRAGFGYFLTVGQHAVFGRAEHSPCDVGEIVNTNDRMEVSDGRRKGGKIDGSLCGGGVGAVAGKHRESVIGLDRLAAYRKGGAILGNALAYMAFGGVCNFKVKVCNVIVVLFFDCHRLRGLSACRNKGYLIFAEGQRKGSDLGGKASVGRNRSRAGGLAVDRNPQGGFTLRLADYFYTCVADRHIFAGLTGGIDLDRTLPVRRVIRSKGGQCGGQKHRRCDHCRYPVHYLFSHFFVSLIREISSHYITKKNRLQ